MNTLLLKVRWAENPKLVDDAYVEDLMTKMMIQFPQIEGYFWERPDDDHIHVMVYGDIVEDED